MFVGRPFLLNGGFSRSVPNSPEGSISSSLSLNRGASANSKYMEHRQQLVESCIEAALKALDVCRSLRDHGPGLARASYTEYSSCRASLLALIAHSIQTHSPEYRSEL